MAHNKLHNLAVFSGVDVMPEVVLPSRCHLLPPFWEKKNPEAAWANSGIVILVRYLRLQKIAKSCHIFISAVELGLDKAQGLHAPPKGSVVQRGVEIVEVDASVARPDIESDIDQHLLAATKAPHVGLDQIEGCRKAGFIGVEEKIQRPDLFSKQNLDRLQAEQIFFMGIFPINHCYLPVKGFVASQFDY